MEKKKLVVGVTYIVRDVGLDLFTLKQSGFKYRVKYMGRHKDSGYLFMTNENTPQEQTLIYPESTVLSWGFITL